MLESPIGKFCYTNHQQIRKYQLNYIKQQVRVQLLNRTSSYQCVFCKNGEINLNSNQTIQSYLSYCLKQDHTICSEHLNDFTRICLKFLCKHYEVINKYIKASNENVLLTNHIYLLLITTEQCEANYESFSQQIIENDLTKIFYEEGPYSDSIQIVNNIKLNSQMQDALSQKYYQQVILLLMQKFPKTFFVYFRKSNCIDNLFGIQNQELIETTYRILINFLAIYKDLYFHASQSMIKREFQVKYLEILQKNVIGKNPQQLRYYQNEYLNLIQLMTKTFQIMSEQRGKQFIKKLGQWFTQQTTHFTKCKYSSFKQIIENIAIQKGQMENQQEESTNMMDIQ